MSLVLRALPWIPRAAVVVLMLIAMVDMIVGVFLRYVMTWASATFDLPTVQFFWVEEVGEFALAWLTFIGAALGIRHGVHFAVHMITDRLPPRGRWFLFASHYVLLAAFGALLAHYGWQVAELNSQSFSPGLDLNLRWLYLSSVVGGVLIVVYSVAGFIDLSRGRGGGIHSPVA